MEDYVLIFQNNFNICVFVNPSFGERFVKVLQFINLKFLVGVFGTLPMAAFFSLQNMDRLKLPWAKGLSSTNYFSTILSVAILIGMIFVSVFLIAFCYCRNVKFCILNNFLGGHYNCFLILPPRNTNNRPYTKLDSPQTANNSEMAYSNKILENEESFDNTKKIGKFIELR